MMPRAARRAPRIAVQTPKRHRRMHALVFALAQQLDPVLIEPPQRTPPGVVDPGFQGLERELTGKIDVAVGKRTGAKPVEQRRAY